MASVFCQLPFDQYDLSSDDSKYLTTNSVAETTPGQNDCAASIFPAARLCLHSPPEALMNRGQINPNLNDYHSNSMEISRTFWIPDITDWSQQHEETNSKHTDLSNVARDIFSIIPPGVGVEASFSPCQNVIGWRQSKSTGGTLREKVVETQFTCAIKGILAGNNSVSHMTITQNDSEMKPAAEQIGLHRMAKVHDFLEIWQGSQALYATQKESCAQNEQRSAVG
jgi:hypothetical protein